MAEDAATTQAVDPRVTVGSIGLLVDAFVAGAPMRYEGSVVADHGRVVGLFASVSVVVETDDGRESTIRFVRPRSIQIVETAESVDAVPAQDGAAS